MTVLGVDVPLWVLDWSGSILVVVSLWFLWHKRSAYWHWSNASLVPYFALFMSGGQYMLAGLQLSYLVFGVHGLWLWRLERLARTEGRAFSRELWYAVGWVLTLAIFCYSVKVTSFIDGWAWFQFAIVSVSLIANLATTRTWVWSWYAWIAVNVAQAVYFWHLELWAQFGLQFVLGAMSIQGARLWRAERRGPEDQTSVLEGPLEGFEDALSVRRHPEGREGEVLDPAGAP